MPDYISNKNLVADVYQHCYVLYPANPRICAKSKLVFWKMAALTILETIFDTSITLAKGFLTDRLHNEELKVIENGYN